MGILRDIVSATVLASLIILANYYRPFLPTQHQQQQQQLSTSTPINTGTQATIPHDKGHDDIIVTDTSVHTKPVSDSSPSSPSPSASSAPSPSTPSAPSPPSAAATAAGGGASSSSSDSSSSTSSPASSKSISRRKDAYSKGIKYAKDGDHQKAIAYFDRAVLEDQEYVRTYLQRALSHYALKNWKRAVHDFTMTMKHHKGHVSSSVFYYRGISLAKLGRYNKCVKDMDFVLHRDPQFDGAHYQRGMCHHEQNHHQEAIRDLGLAIQRKATAVRYYNRGLVHVNAKKFMFAIMDFSKAIELDPAYAAAYYNRSVAKRLVGDAVGSQEDFEISLRMGSQKK